MVPDPLHAEGECQGESVEQLAFTDRIRLNQFDPVPDKAELTSTMKRIPGIYLQAPISHAHLIGVGPILLIKPRRP